MPHAATPGHRARALRATICRLAALASETAETAAALALLLARVADAENGISADETHCIEGILTALERVEEDQAVLLTEIGKHRLRDLGGPGTYRIVRELRRSASREELVGVLERLVAVAASDGAVTPTEAAAIRQVAAELGLGRELVGDALECWGA
jgi:uncharacterized tellurite resistance protein B-like protein